MSLLPYASEKLNLGVHELATHSGKIKERLISAFNTSLAQVPDKDLPPDARKIWDRVWRQVTALGGTAQSGKFEPSINALRDDEVLQIAKDIVTVQVMVKAALSSRE
jgi:hypothetical protein